VNAVNPWTEQTKSLSGTYSDKLEASPMSLVPPDVVNTRYSEGVTDMVAWLLLGLKYAGCILFCSVRRALVRKDALNVSSCSGAGLKCLH